MSVDFETDLKNFTGEDSPKGHLAKALSGLSANWRELYGPLPEHIIVVESQFTRVERKRLKDDGAYPHLLVGETIGLQREGGRRFWSTWHKGQPIEALASRVMEVAIYPEPERFFVPGTFNKPAAEREALVKQDGEDLRNRLKLPGIDEVVPQAPEATEVLFKHLDKTGIYLLGEDYRDTETSYYLYMGTKTPTNKEGSNFALVGRFVVGDGPRVDYFPVGGSYPGLGGARWVVKKGTK